VSYYSTACPNSTLRVLHQYCLSYSTAVCLSAAPDVVFQYCMSHSSSQRAVGDFNVSPYHLRAVQGLEGLHTTQPIVLQVVPIFLRGKCNKHT
jgi:hypothetical protein